MFEQVSSKVELSTVLAFTGFSWKLWTAPWPLLPVSSSDLVPAGITDASLFHWASYSAKAFYKLKTCSGLHHIYKENVHASYLVRMIIDYCFSISTNWINSLLFWKLDKMLKYHVITDRIHWVENRSILAWKVIVEECYKKYLNG